MLLDLLAAFKAAAMYDLAAGNTNPQGIADPPAAGSASTSSPVVVGKNDNWLAAAAAWSVDQATTASLGTQATDRFLESARVGAAGRGRNHEPVGEAARACSFSGERYAGVGHHVPPPCSAER